MNSSYRKSWCILACMVAFTSHPVVAAPFMFDDIEFWVGTGANRAALVIDWVEMSPDPPALVWGYRWDGVATGYDMLRSVVEVDDRLFAKLGEFDEGASLFGLGYDVDNDDHFGALKFNHAGQPIETVFDETGIALSGSPDADGRSRDGHRFGRLLRRRLVHCRLALRQ